MTPRADGPDEWHRLSPGMMAVRPVELAPQILPTLIGIFFAAQAAPLIALGIAIVLAPLVTVVPWLTTTYQVTGEHVRVRRGVINRKVATARRDRIRSVETTASLVHRVLSLEKVTIGTGSDKESSNVVLTAVGKQYATGLRDYLMPTGTPAVTQDAGVHDAGAGTTGADAAGTTQPTHATEVLARFGPRWLRYSPFSILGMAAAAAIFGFGAQFADEFDLYSLIADAGAGLWDRAGDVPVAVIVAAGVVAIVIAGGVLSVIAYILSYWGFTLSRHDDGTLRIRRGLLTTTSTTLDENRIRGVHLHEPLLMRPLHGARLHAVATGAQKHPLLLPPAPIDVVDHVGVAVSGEGAGLHGPVNAHPPAARRRRFTRAVLGALLVSVVPILGWALGWPSLAATLSCVVVLVAGGAALAELRYRNLGHRLTSRTLVIGAPTTARHRNLLHRDGIIGWSVRSSWFQRRQGLVTLVAASAAGLEAYGVVDIDGADATGLAAEISPALIGPFLGRRYILPETPASSGSGPAETTRPYTLSHGCPRPDQKRQSDSAPR